MKIHEMLKKLELSEADHFELIQYCRYKNVKFFSTAFDLDSIDFLASLKLGLWKIPSGEVTNYPYLKKIAKYQESVILSTGMCTISDVETAINVLLKFGANKNQLTLLHCTTEYPTPFNDVNLLAMNVMAQKFGVKVGYSDHTKGIEVPIAAVALGAIVIEKHFTLNRNMEGPDHKASLEPEELTQMVNAIRNVELAISGDGIKAPSESELQNISIVRKSIVAAKKIIKGDVFSEDNLTTKRSGIGISPMMWDEVMGNKAKRDFEEDESIEL